MAAEKFKGKVVLITGAASGIGAATAKQFAQLGAILSLMDLNGDDLKKVGEECSALGQKFGNRKALLLVGDIGNDEIRAKFVNGTLKEFGRIDVLFNNAGIEIPTSVLSTSMETFDKLFNIHVRAPYDMSRLCAPHLITSKGCIINVASVTSHVVGIKNPGYCSSKAAIRHLTSCLADELGEYQVRVVSISPGIIRTNIHKGRLLTPEQLEKFYDNMSENMCLNRTGTPEEIAKAAAFLASPDAGFITGSDMVVDGGFLAKSATL